MRLRAQPCTAADEDIVELTILDERRKELSQSSRHTLYEFTRIAIIWQKERQLETDWLIDP